MINKKYKILIISAFFYFNIPSSYSSSIDLNYLSQFDGEAPWELVEDENIGAKIREIVPRTFFKCMDNNFNYIEDLKINKNGLLKSVAHGARVDSFIESYISVTPNGLIDIVLLCDHDLTSENHKEYYFFTSSGVNSKPSQSLISWFNILGLSEKDKIIQSDGSHSKELSFSEFMKYENVNSANESSIKKTNSKINSEDSKENFLAFIEEDVIPDLIKHLEVEANAGDSQSQYLLGVLYDEGKEIPQDCHKAFEWFKKSANNGFTSAQYELGRIYTLNKIVPQDYAKSREWFEKSALKEHAESQFYLGGIYLQGLSTQRDTKKAKYWFGKSCSNGYKEGCNIYKVMNN